MQVLLKLLVVAALQAEHTGLVPERMAATRAYGVIIRHNRDYRLFGRWRLGRLG